MYSIARLSLTRSHSGIFLQYIVYHLTVPRNFFTLFFYTNIFLSFVQLFLSYKFVLVFIEDTVCISKSVFPFGIIREFG